MATGIGIELSEGEHLLLRKIKALEEKVNIIWEGDLEKRFLKEIAELRSLVKINEKGSNFNDKQIVELKDDLHASLDYTTGWAKEFMNAEKVLLVLKEGIIRMLIDIKAHRGLRLYETVFLENLKKKSKILKKEE